MGKAKAKAKKVTVKKEEDPRYANIKPPQLFEKKIINDDPPRMGVPDEAKDFLDQAVKMQIAFGELCIKIQKTIPHRDNQSIDYAWKAMREAVSWLGGSINMEIDLDKYEETKIQIKKMAEQAVKDALAKAEEKEEAEKNPIQ